MYLETLLMTIIIKDQKIIFLGYSCPILRPKFNMFKCNILSTFFFREWSCVILYDPTLKKLGRKYKIF